jgi:hypothetical protein
VTAASNLHPLLKTGDSLGRKASACRKIVSNREKRGLAACGTRKSRQFREAVRWPIEPPNHFAKGSVDRIKISGTLSLIRTADMRENQRE